MEVGDVEEEEGNAAAGEGVGEARIDVECPQLNSLYEEDRGCEA